MLVGVALRVSKGPWRGLSGVLAVLPFVTGGWWCAWGERLLLTGVTWLCWGVEWLTMSPLLWLDGILTGELCWLESSLDVSPLLLLLLLVV